MLEQYKRALQASEARFRNLIEKNADGVVVVRHDGVLLFVNPAAETLLGHKAEHLQGAMFGIPILPGETTEVDLPHGPEPNCVAEMRVVGIDWGGERAYLASLRNVTERKRSREALRFLAEASTALAGSLDTTTTLTTMAHLAVPHLAEGCLIDLLDDGPTVRRMAADCGEPLWKSFVAGLQGRHMLDMQTGLGLPQVLRSGAVEVCHDVQDAFLETLAAGPEQRCILQQLGCKAVLIVPLSARNHILGAITLLSTSHSRRYDTAGLALARDLARRAALALDNARLYDEAQHALRRRDEFLAVLAHELRNPLAGMLGAAQLMAKLDGPLEPALEQTRDVVERQGRHMSRLLDDLLDISRVTYDKIVLRKERLDLRAALAETVKANRPLVEEQGVQLRVEVAAVPLWVDADPTRLEQVLANLLNNAAKYTPSGGHINVTAKEEGGQAVVRVRDDGLGIPPEMLTHVFDLFLQVEASLDRSKGGLGIGLTLVRRLVELHGGGVSAHSTGRGQGSEFVVRLPLRPGPSPAANAGVGELARKCSSRRVLLLEDNADARRMLRQLLECWGHEVEEVGDGVEGLARLRGGRVDVALVDIGLPGMNGYEVAAALRSGATLPRVFLIAVTGYGQPEDRQRALEAGFDAHLVKPVDLKELERILNAL
jgi:signal transduction histidine kinase